MSGSSRIMPVVSKVYCSPSLTTLTVRKRPHVVNGGGFVVTDCTPKTVFTVDGCGTIGSKGELMVRDEDGSPILQIQKKGGVIQVLSTSNRWKGYLTDDEGPSKLVFSLREMRACLVKNGVVRICIEPKTSNKDYDFVVHGSFLDKACTIVDRSGRVVAQVTVGGVMRGSKEFYQVVVQPGYDQAFVVGVIAVLDNMHGESTRC